MGNIITNERHKTALIHSSLELSNAINALKAKEPLEMVEITTHMAYDFLGEIIGETAGEEILDAVFEKFCLDKSFIYIDTHFSSKGINLLYKMSFSCSAN